MVLLRNIQNLFLTGVDTETHIIADSKLKNSEAFQNYKIFPFTYLTADEFINIDCESLRQLKIDPDFEEKENHKSLSMNELEDKFYQCVYQARISSHVEPEKMYAEEVASHLEKKINQFDQSPEFKMMNRRLEKKSYQNKSGSGICTIIKIDDAIKLAKSLNVNLT